MGIFDGLFPTAQPAPTLDGILAGSGPDVGTLASVTAATQGVQGDQSMVHQAYVPPQLSGTERMILGLGMAPAMAVYGTAVGAGRALSDLPGLTQDAYQAGGFAAPSGPVTENSVQDAQADVAGRLLGVAGLIGGVSAPFERPAGSLGIFGGRMAKTADLDNFDIAQARSSLMGAPGYEDVTSHSIMADTGWFPGADGNARFEIPDYAARVIPDAPAQGKLPQLLDHPQLYDAYPHFADMTYSVAPGEDGWSGTYSQAQNHIDIAPSEYPEELKATILHELQHGVQAREGFARGGDARMLAGGQDAYNRLMGEVEARNVETRMRMPDDLRADIPPWATESVRRPQQLLTAPSILDEYFAARPNF